MSDELEEINKEYRKEAKEILKKMQSSCEMLKERSDNGVVEILQCSHKIKGIAGMMDDSHIEELAKQMEYVSQLLVEQKLRLKPEIVAILVESTNLLAKYIETDFEERDMKLLEKLGKISNV